MNDGVPSAINRNAFDRWALLELGQQVPQHIAPRFEWTQFPGHGPGIELFGELSGKRVLELGCGRGDNLAALAARDAHCVGVDISAYQVISALVRWHGTDINVHCADVHDFLEAVEEPFDIVYSVFGAIGFCPPDRLLGFVRNVILRGGQLLFAVPDPDWLHGRDDHLVLPDSSTVPVARWLMSTKEWQRLLDKAGFANVTAMAIEAPVGGGPTCSIFSAKA